MGVIVFIAAVLVVVIIAVVIVIIAMRNRGKKAARILQLKAQMKEWENEGYNVSRLKDLFKK